MLQYLRERLLFISTVIGNVLDHYDSALYVYLAPFLVPIFFPKSDPVVGLILIYGLKFTGIITRPFGAMLFGHLAAKYPIKNVLAITLMGVAICTFCLGIIPGYNHIGIFAPILLCIVRAVQGMFASGEHSIASLFLIEQTKNDQRYGRASSYYLCSTMGGTLSASFAAMLVSNSRNHEFYWRIAFMLGLVTGIIGVIIRVFNSPEVLENGPIKQNNFKNSVSFLGENKLKLFKISIFASFSFLTYTLPFVFLNNFIPLVSDIKFNDLLIHNTILLAIDILMIPIFGILADKFSYSKIMFFSACALAVTIMPIFYILPMLTLMQITLIKTWIIILGVAFVAPLNALLLKLTQGQQKYLISGVGYSLGTEILGRNIPVICLLLWKITNNTLAPALYILLICIATAITLTIGESREAM